ncbi:MULTISPECIES: hypothetical protein [Streptomyces]|uniref:Integrase n=2 Tax=Streptomyces TaxID=1883 RepID=A0ABV9J6B6_9ACTN
MSQPRVRMPRLTFSPQVVNQDPTPPHQHRRLAMFRRVLNNDSLPLRTRTAAALVLLYAQPVTRIVRLTLEDVMDDGSPRRRSPSVWETRRPRSQSPPSA